VADSSATIDDVSDDDHGTSLSPDTTTDLGLSAHEQQVLDRVKTVAKLLDEAVRIPVVGVRIGIDPIVSAVPVAGNLLSTAFSLYPIVEAYRLGVSGKTIAAMVTLVAVDALTAAVPVAGTVVDAFWKANEWNVRLLERDLRGR
jgi:hypothetical protein